MYIAAMMIKVYIHQYVDSGSQHDTYRGALDLAVGEQAANLFILNKSLLYLRHYTKCLNY